MIHIPILGKNLGSSDKEREPSGKPTDIAVTLLARDYKGFSNYASNMVIEVSDDGDSKTW